MDGRILVIGFLRLMDLLDLGLGLVFCLIFLGIFFFFIVAMFLFEYLGRVKLDFGKLQLGTAEIMDGLVVVCCINCCCCCC